MTEIVFEDFPKIARLNRQCIISEKIDGTNGCIYIGGTDGQGGREGEGAIYFHDGYFIHAGSRSQWITPENDNHGFAKWVVEHGEELIKLGPGRHFGEWWGSGIQRGYGLSGGEKRFSLFNVSRWDEACRDPAKHPTPRPACCATARRTC